MDILKDKASLQYFCDWIAAASSIEELSACIETHLRCCEIEALAYAVWPESQNYNSVQSHIKIHFGLSSQSRRYIESQYKIDYNAGTVPFLMTLEEVSLASMLGGHLPRHRKTILILPLNETEALRGYMALQFDDQFALMSSQKKMNLIKLSQAIHSTYEKLTDKLHQETELLSPLELEIIRWAALGKSDKKIADILSLTPQSLERHMSSIFKKLGVYDRIKAGLRAIALGLI